VKRFKILVTGAAIATTASLAVAQSPLTANTLRLDDAGRGVEASLDSLTWMAGSWLGVGLGGEVEEMWSPPSAGTMVGTFKLIQQGQPVFYEFFVITDDGGSPVLKLKHFNPDMEGWEEKDGFVTFKLIKVEDGAAYFGGLTYRRVGEDRMEVFLAMRRKGELEEVAFELERRHPKLVP